ncbi:hypothetical protein IB277_31175 [Ensifer sp. ENS07]|uniref:hypothetical protein n=1 Tax=Ensifer sp. ENS07 TaxID=2769274 RepID=UPI001780A8F5|nr:hypothetical protein [Ensifer sp. ENS07]MBD9640762.1 hypothetical protein [Ensifer sp. ENS07]
MNSFNATTSQQAAKAPKAACPNDHRLDAFMELETEVLDLMNMSAITSDIVLDFFSQPEAREGKYVVFRISEDFRDRLCFAVANVSNRADALATNYMTAFCGEVRS